ncbi:MAG TPA: CheR family methyltransferase, partial [Dehalococcoidia bacterium]|nr:CheR family methyltransferase [Dehalococcoidia bacterium]
MPAASPEFEALLAYLRDARAFDFTGYKRSSLERRVRKRMATIGVRSFEEYTDYLQVHPEEFPALFNEILINVTEFFRDQPAWDFLASNALPRLILNKRGNAPIRVWSAGCATGEEAYSIAILFGEAFGFDQFRDRVKIYATDVDEDALNAARQGIYSARQLANVPAHLVERYFEPTGTSFSFRRDLRRSIIFGRHDIAQDAPISRIDLLACRNVLMYFNSEAQARILARFHFAIADSGYLFLGKAEMLLGHSTLFVPVDLRRRIFVKAGSGTLRDRLLVMAQSGNEEAVTNLVGQVRTREVAFDAGPVAQIVVDPNGALLLANERARGLFSLGLHDLGRPLQDLELSYRPAELRSCIEQAKAERRSVRLPEVAWQTASTLQYFDIEVTPLVANGNTLIAVSVTFTDVSRYRQLHDDLTHASQELETAYEELQSTNEELETTNEELQSTVEELETTNEELQSTNEELETMNEELQSVNEELQTINDELRERSDQLNQVNAFLQSILASLQQAVVVLDTEMCVQIWSTKAEDLWGLREDEVVNKSFFTLDVGLAIDGLRTAIRGALAGSSESTVLVQSAINRRGRGIQCQTTITPLRGAAGHVHGAILLMEEA